VAGTEFFREGSRARSVPAHDRDEIVTGVRLDAGENPFIGNSSGAYKTPSVLFHGEW
jgi:hypothetical protein